MAAFQLYTKFRNNQKTDIQKSNYNITGNIKTFETNLIF